MRSIDGRTGSRLSAAVALLAAVWMLTLASDTALPWADATASHHPHVISTSPDSGSVVLRDHLHLQASSVPMPPQMLTAALPPRAGMVLAALGLIAALVGAATLFAHVVLPAMRGPPPKLATLLTGRQVLTQFCIARR